MNKNKDNYKETFSAFEPSEKAVERAFEITTDKRKFSKNVIFRRTAAAMLAFVLVIGGGFGLNFAVDRKTPTYETLGVMVAMAGETDLLEAGKANEQDVFYGIYVADLEDEEAMKAAVSRWQADKTRQEQLGQEMEKKFGKKRITRSYSSSSGACYSERLQKETAAFYTMSAGLFLLNLFDYTNVKDITIENTSRYGTISVYYWDDDYDLSEMDMDIYYEVFGKDSIGYSTSKDYTFGETEDKIVLTKDTLLSGVERGAGDLWTVDGVVKPGYSFDWNPSGYLQNCIGEDVNFDLSQIKDTILFTVNYDDGTSEQASVSIAFDSDGYMHIVDAD